MAVKLNTQHQRGTSVVLSETATQPLPGHNVAATHDSAPDARRAPCYRRALDRSRGGWYGSRIMSAGIKRLLSIGALATVGCIRVVTIQAKFDPDQVRWAEEEGAQ